MENPYHINRDGLKSIPTILTEPTALACQSHRDGLILLPWILILGKWFYIVTMDFNPLKIGSRMPIPSGWFYIVAMDFNPWNIQS